MTSNKTGFLRSFANWQLIASIIGLVFYLITKGNFFRVLGISFIITNSISIQSYLLQTVLEKKFQFYLKPWPQKVFYWTVIILSGTVSGTLLGVWLVSLLFKQEYIYFFKNNLWWFLGFCILAAVVITTLEIMVYNLKEKIEKKVLENEELKRLQMRTQLIALQSKINPHFLFNTLNTMLNLIYKSPQKVETMILNLSDIYRRVLQVPEN
jgi:sensor histidine kinase YesM